MSSSPHKPLAISNSSADGASEHPPPQLQPIRPRLASSHASPSSSSPTPLQESRPLRSKRSPVLAACNNCRKKKSRCDGKRPNCGPCLQSSVDCAYAIPEGLTAREAQKRKLDETSGANETYQSIVRLLRHGSEDDAQAAFRHLRDPGSVQDPVRSLADASLLVPLPDSSSSRPSATPPEQRHSPSLKEEPQPPTSNPPPLLENAPRSDAPSPMPPTPARSSSLRQGSLQQDPTSEADV